MERKILKVADGQAYGDFTISHLPFYPGLYELRAYTKYMLNFGQENYFSRAIPIFEKTQQNTDAWNISISKRVNSKFTTIRETPKKRKKVNVNFYPEGGQLVKGIQSRVAFEASDATGKPITLNGHVIVQDTLRLTNIEVSHQGKGIFEYTPTESDAYVVAVYDRKKYKFKLPRAVDSGYVLKVDNLNDSQKIRIVVSHQACEVKDTVGVLLLSQGRMVDYTCVATTFESPVYLSFEKNLCQPGISEVIVIDKSKRAVANRFIFTHGDNAFKISHTLDKSVYAPFEPITLHLTLKQKNGMPVTAPFSLAVRDGSNEIEWNRNIMTDLLLMSDIRGYVADPAYYFEKDDIQRRHDLDLLLMVQGWRKYPWNATECTGMGSLKYPPEKKGIIVTGTVSAYNLKKTRSDMDVSLLMVKLQPDDNGAKPFINDRFMTDSLGQFHFAADVEGDWDMIFAASKNNKKQNVSISISNQPSLNPREYAPYEYDIERIDSDKTLTDLAYTEDSDSTDIESWLLSRDSIMLSRQFDKAITLREIEVKGKKTSKADDILRIKTNSVAVYDFKESIDNLYNAGVYYCNDVNTILCKLNHNFFLMRDGDFNYILYRQRLPLVVVDYETTYLPDEFRYNDLPVEWIKSVYITEHASLIHQYSDPRVAQPTDRYSCVVFIETFPENKRPVEAGIGVRKTIFHGYDTASEFYYPDYSSYVPDDDDYRRTLYWNPMVTPDENGNAEIRFFNNGSCLCPTVDDQTMTSEGMFGISQ